MNTLVNFTRNKGFVVALAVALLMLLSAKQVRGGQLPVADSTSYSSGPGPTLSWSHTVNAGANRMLLVAASIYDNKTVSALNYGGTSLTRVGSQAANGNKNRVEIWSLLAPAVGTAKITMTVSGSVDVVGGAVSFSGVNQSNPLGAFASTQGSNTAPSINVASATSQIVFDVVSAGSDVFAVDNPDQDVQWDGSTGTGNQDINGAGSVKPGAPTVSMLWNLSKSASWALAALPLNGAVSSFAPPLAPDACSSCQLGYPVSTSNLRTAAIFNESEVLRAFDPAQGCTSAPNATIKLWYNDEHALTMGVRQVTVTQKLCVGGPNRGSSCTSNSGCPASTCGASASTSTNYPVAPLSGNPSHVAKPAIGANAMSGDQAGTDTNICSDGSDCGRPMWPALFITDITSDSTSRSGDWQYGGAANSPSDVFGTWKAAIKTVDKTRSPAVVSVTPDADPAKNDWNLGAGSDAPPAGLVNQGYGAEVRWNVMDLRVNGKPLIGGHLYRLQFMVHDGDQNKVGGDAGQACVNVRIPVPDLAIFTRAPAIIDRSQTQNTLTYTITVTNNGLVSASNVVVTDALPSGTKFNSGASSQGSSSFDSKTGVFSASLGDVAPGATVSITIVVKITVATGSTISNTASVGADGVEPNQANNSSTSSTLVTASGPY